VEEFETEEAFEELLRAIDEADERLKRWRMEIRGESQQ
jgi:hypothetical protein